ncbi:MAG: hypothetical protein AAF705_14405 [Bacteroidota bacterium]
MKDYQLLFDLMLEKYGLELSEEELKEIAEVASECHAREMESEMLKQMKRTKKSLKEILNPDSKKD